MLAIIKTLLGIVGTAKDALLQVLISQATNDVLVYCNLAELPGLAEPIIIDLVIRRYNLLGTEGLNSESYSGVDFNYSTDLPKDIMLKLQAFRKIRVISND